MPEEWGAKQLEVIFTSGFSYLFDTSKEITIIVREKS